MNPALTISAMPATISLRGNVSSVARSTSTAAGWWNAPTRFLPASVLMPVLPPTAASTMPSSVVGTCTMSTPRSQVAAANPATSVAAPPPRLTIASLRPTPMRPNTSQMKPTTGSSLPASASGISMRCASIPLSDRWFRIDFGGLRQHRLVQDRDLVPAVEDAVQLAEQPGADDHRVGRVDEDVDGHGLSHGARFRVARGQRRRRRGGASVRRRRGQRRRAAAPRRATAPSRRVRRIAGSPAAPRCGAPPRRGCGGWC